MRGWDDPRMPTLSGMRRRGFPAEGIRDFATHGRRRQVRQHGRGRACSSTPARRAQPQGAAPLRRARPAQGGHHQLPRGPGRGDGRRPTTPRTRRRGTRKVPFSRELCIERDDFMEEPLRKFFRLAPGPRGAPAVGLLHHLQRGGQGRRRARSWSCAAPTTRRRAAATRPTAAGSRPPCTGSPPAHAVPAEVRLYDHLFTEPAPRRRRPRLLRGPEPRLRDGAPRLLRGAVARRPPVGETVQFERLGYFCPDPDSAPDAPVFNRTLTLKDTWAKIQKQGRQRQGLSATADANRPLKPVSPVLARPEPTRLSEPPPRGTLSAPVAGEWPNWQGT